MELLLKQQADPSIKKEEDWTALMIASQNGHYNVVELLLKQQANLNNEQILIFKITMEKQPL